MIDKDSPPKKFYPWLFAADALAVAAITLYYFSSKPAPTESEKIFAIIGVLVAGLFVFIPILLDQLRTPPPPLPMPEIEKNFRRQYENQRILQDEIRSLGDALVKRIAGIETRVTELATAGNNTRNLQPALGEIADRLATLTSITGEDGDLPRLRTSVEEIQTQLDLFADAIRNLEEKLAEHRTAPEPDGPLPASLMAKAFSSGTQNTAVNRLIENGGLKNTPPATDEPEKTIIYEDEDDLTPSETHPESGYNRPKTPPPGMPAEDEIWTSAQDMADDEKVDQPDMLDELGLSPEAPKPHRPRKHETALIINAIIGIGNKPYIRGTGPGLTPDTGVPMEYVAIGKWRWIAPDASMPAKVSIWKNDIIRAKGDDIELHPGGTTETNPVFPE